MTIRRNRPLRLILRVAAALAAAVALLLIAFGLWALGGTIADPEPGFHNRKGELLSATRTATREMRDGTLSEITLTSTSGLTVNLALRKPHTALPGRPLLLMMGGQETGREAAALLPETRGITVAALSYPFATILHREGAALALALRDIQQGILDMPPSAMLALDYLLARPDLATEQVELAGISFGAFLAAVPGALDERIDRVWLVHGAGKPALVLKEGLEGRIDSALLRAGAARFLAAAAVAHHLRPELWVGRISPRPVIVINARDDTAVPAEAVAALNSALEPPSDVLWTEGDHVHPKRPAVIREIADLIFTGMSETATGE